MVLEQAGHEIWIDNNLRVGENWQQQLRDAIAACDAVVLALTPNWISSPYCPWEFVTGVELDKTIIPVKLTDVAIPERIAELQFADFSDGFSDDERVEKFLTDLHAMSQKLARQERDIATRQQAEQTIQQQINQANPQNTTIGNVSGGGEKQRGWTIPVIPGLLIAFIGTVAAVVALLPEPDRSNLLYSVALIDASETPTSTPTFTPTPEVIAAEDDEILIILARFDQLSTNREPEEVLELRLNEALEIARAAEVNVRLDLTSEVISSRERAREVAEEFGATLVIWGIVEPAAIEARYEIVVADGQRIATRVEETAFQAISTVDEVDIRISNPSSVLF